MKVLHSGTLDVRYGGPALSTYLTIKGLLHQGIGTGIIMSQSATQSELVGNDVDIYYTRPVMDGKFGYIPHLKSVLNNIPDVDLYHVQGIWQYLSHYTSLYAREKGCPYVVTLRGMLYPQALLSNKWIKKVSLLCYQARDLQAANCVQATCKDEMQYYRQLGFNNPVAIIPNPIDVSRIGGYVKCKNNNFTIGYLGRLHPRKRVERLIYSIADLKGQIGADTQLIIIGSDNVEYERFLRHEVQRLNLAANVRFVGFLTGQAKIDILKSLSILAVPSDFENFGNIVTEALLYGIPVIASKGMPWKELPEYGCGWWIDNDQETINSTVLEAYNKGETELYKMGQIGQKFVRDKYSVEALGEKMVRLYRWILDGKDKPDFVYEN